MAIGNERLNIQSVEPNAYKAVLAMEKYVGQSGLENSLIELIKIRTSQINNCAFCLDMHLRDARKEGEDQRRLDILSAWHEAPTFFSARERAAFALTEAVTEISLKGVPDDVWDAVSEEFSQNEIVHLIMAICAINTWNRLAISTHQALPEL